MSKSSNISPLTSPTGTEQSTATNDNVNSTPTDRGRALRRSARNRSPIVNDEPEGEKSSETGPNRSSPSDSPNRPSNRLQAMINGAASEDNRKTTTPPATSAKGKGKADGKQKETKVWCWCNGKGDGENWALCSNFHCKKEWFHWKCVKLGVEPKGVWLCPECAILPECWTWIREEQNQ